MRDFFNNKYCIIFIYYIIPILVCWIIPIILFFLGYIFIIGDIWLCDDGNLSSYRVNGWGGELDGRPIVNSNNAITEGYNIPESYNTTQNYNNNYDSNVRYEPYRPWYMQETSQGMRYEMDGNGRRYYPYGPDSYNNNNYESESTLLGERQPTGSEMEISSEYTIPFLHNKGESFRKSIWRFIKDDINKSREKYAAARELSRVQNNASISGRDIRAARHADWVKRQKVFYEENKKIEWARTIRKTRKFD